MDKSLVISRIWGSSFVFVKLITESMDPFAFAASRGLIAMPALLVWLRREAPASDNGMLLWKPDNPGAVEGVQCNGSLHCIQGTLAAVARKPRTGARS
jgi:drug/metabolite transporter (DMT)-like permease